MTALANITLLSTFSEHITRTNQIIAKIGQIEGNVHNTINSTTSSISATANAALANVDGVTFGGTLNISGDLNLL